MKKQVSFSQAIEGYFLAAHARRLSPHTMRDYDHTFRKFEVYLGDDRPLEDVTSGQIQEFLAGFPHLTAKTVLNYHIGLSALWTWAVGEDLAEANVVRAVRRPKPEQREVLPYTERDVRAMLDACRRTRPYARPGKRKCDNERPTALRDKAIVMLLVDTGMRSSELCGLRAQDVDVKNGWVMVMGKGRKERQLRVDSRTGQALWRYEASKDERERGRFAFATRSGRPLNRQNLYHMVRRLGERAGVPGATVHRFRHTFAINFLRNRGSVFALQRILGHSTLEMVNRYLALAQSDIEQAHREASPVANWLL